MNCGCEGAEDVGAEGRTFAGFAPASRAGEVGGFFGEFTADFATGLAKAGGLLPGVLLAETFGSGTPGGADIVPDFETGVPIVRDAEGSGRGAGAGSTGVPEGTRSVAAGLFLGRNASAAASWARSCEDIEASAFPESVGAGAATEPGFVTAHHVIPVVTANNNTQPSIFREDDFRRDLDAVNFVAEIDMGRAAWEGSAIDWFSMVGRGSESAE